MGGHGALTIALKNPGRYRSVSAFSPIVAPSQVPWGQKALGAYLGEDREAWAAHDTVELLKSAPERLHLLVDQGDADEFLESQLRPQLLQAACDTTGHPLTLRMQPGYDHSYYFIESFIGEHIATTRALEGVSRGLRCQGRSVQAKRPSRARLRPCPARRRGEHRPIGDRCGTLRFAAGIGVRGQRIEQRLVERAAREAGIELLRVHAAQRGA